MKITAIPIGELLEQVMQSLRTTGMQEPKQETAHTCPDCGGEGLDRHSTGNCGTCRGAGAIIATT